MVFEIRWLQLNSGMKRFLTEWEVSLRLAITSAMVTDTGMPPMDLPMGGRREIKYLQRTNRELLESGKLVSTIVLELSSPDQLNAYSIKSRRASRDKPWSTLCKKSHGIPSFPRAAAVAKFRLLTGHDCLCAHLFRFNLVTSPICVLCDTGQDMTAAHLDECSALNDLNCIVKRYWRARCLIT
ncbi:uncharacterized protein TNCV_195191 [Trichonephila clavipes]|uniref:Uncharacterized protein n=1 Tax=Trichonephila clavipes TaxID=2585209 RepID=A0A8X6WKF2_TRICX|nr:uncharacterized protein TNCV_195191 [Trichonephila clavipes]